MIRPERSKDGDNYMAILERGDRNEGRNQDEALLSC